MNYKTNILDLKQFRVNGDRVTLTGVASDIAIDVNGDCEFILDDHTGRVAVALDPFQRENYAHLLPERRETKHLTVIGKVEHWPGLSLIVADEIRAVK